MTKTASRTPIPTSISFLPADSGDFVHVGKIGGRGAGSGRQSETESVAEGVENAAQLERLRTLGCSGAQGFYFAEALPAADLTALLRDGVTWPALRPALVAQT